MGLCVTFVSGPRHSGKSALVETMIDKLCKYKPHYIRLVKTGSKTQPGAFVDELESQNKSASARVLEYNPELIFEILPDALSAIHRRDRYGLVIIEADADPILRCAYPYDHRVFIMPSPSDIHEVFRDPDHAADELKKALDDTAAFASEIFGLFADSTDSGPDPHEVRPDMTTTQMRGFLYSPLGDELATRIQLQPPYHGLVESDVIVINDHAGECGSQTEPCILRIEHLLDRLSGVSGKRGELFFCNPMDHSGKDCKKLLKALAPLCEGGK